MAPFRLSRLAQADLAHILATSAERWGIEASRRYAAILAAAMRKIGAEPQHAASRARAQLSRGVRSFHLRHVRSSETKVRKPVHVLYYRVTPSGLVEIVRVLYERMEPSRHVESRSED
jgi:toxin ParE1/3/4